MYNCLPTVVRVEDSRMPTYGSPMRDNVSHREDTYCVGTVTSAHTNQSLASVSVKDR